MKIHHLSRLSCFCRWVFIATHLPGQTDSEIKNYLEHQFEEEACEKGNSPCHSDTVVPTVTSCCCFFGFLCELYKGLCPEVALRCTATQSSAPWSWLHFNKPYGRFPRSRTWFQLSGYGRPNSLLSRPVWPFEYQFSKYDSFPTT